MDDILRRRLMHALKDRRWTELDSQRAAEGIASIYLAEESEWRVWPTGNAARPDLFYVARRLNDVSVYDSLLEGRARDVANALNEVERPDADATGTP